MPEKQPRDAGPSVLAAAVPKILHQTFYRADLPPELEASVANMRQLNPGWQYRFYDDADVADFIRTQCPARVFDQFNRINPEYGAARADLFRYLLLHTYGGVYLDIKSTATRPLDDVVQSHDRYLLSQWQRDRGHPFQGPGLHPELHDVPGGEFQQWHIVAAPGHPFLDAVIERVLRNIDRYNPGLHDVGQAGVLRVTGPIAYTRAIAPILQRHAHRIVDARADLGFEYSIFERQGHTALFPQHYARLRSPVIHIGALKQISASAYRLLRTIRNAAPAGVRKALTLRSRSEL